MDKMFTFSVMTYNTDLPLTISIQAPNEHLARRNIVNSILGNGVFVNSIILEELPVDHE